MNKRVDAIRTLFASPQSAAMAGDNMSPEPNRVRAGAVRSLKDSFSGVERENEALRARLAATQGLAELDPSSIDPSPIIDRFPTDSDPSFDALKRSMSEHGQEVPVLVRIHPAVAGRYQAAYGHRRIRAARELGRPIKAIIRELSDEELIIAQGLENSAREDLSFIERANFARRMEEAGHRRLVVQQALSIDSAEAARLITVARKIPSQIVDAIGRAPKVGRPRWLELVEFVQDKSAAERAMKVTTSSAFATYDSDRRFLAVFAAAGTKPQAAPANATETISSDQGQAIAKIRRLDREIKLSIDRAAHPEFADFLVSKLPSLFEAYCAANRGSVSEPSE